MAYFDNNATTRPCEAALAAHSAALAEDWRNPSAPSSLAARLRVKLEDARRKLAALLTLEPESLSFTSGATEANNAVFAHLAREAAPASRILLSPVEHPSVREPALRHFPNRVEELPADASGVVSPGDLTSALDAGGIALVAVMAANNETGVVQPWRELAALCRDRGVPFHCDATQWVGKLSPEGFATCDYLTASAHKFGGLKGVGILKAPSDLRFLVGGEQESGRRAGTENYPGVAAMLAALEEANAFDQVPLLEQTRDAFEETLLAALPGLRVLGKDANRLWNSTALLMPVHENLRWVGKLEKLGHEISTGSACATGKEGPSHVAAALGLSPEEARRIVRVSGSRETLPEDWVVLAEAFRAAFSEIQAASGSVEVVSV